MPKARPKKEKSATAGHRLLDASALLMRASGATMEELMRELGISRSTAVRYMEALGQRGLEPDVIGDREGRKVHRISQKAQSHAVVFTLEEVFWLKVMEMYTNSFAGTGIDDAIARVVAKVDATLRPKERARVTDLHRKIVDIPDPKHDYSGKADVIDELMSGLLASQPVMIKQESKRAEQRKIRFDPYSLVTHKRALYIAGFSHHHNAVRTFAVDGILSASRLKDETFAYPENYDPEERFEGAFGLMTGEETDVTIRFDASVEPWLRQRKWHATQSLTRKGRWLYLKMRPRGTTELLTWILGWGAKATVLAPASLREEWMRQAEAMAAAGREVGEKEAKAMGAVGDEDENEGDLGG